VGDGRGRRKTSEDGGRRRGTAGEVGDGRTAPLRTLDSWFVIVWGTIIVLRALRREREGRGEGEGRERGGRGEVAGSGI